MRSGCVMSIVGLGFFPCSPEIPWRRHVRCLKPRIWTVITRRSRLLPRDSFPQTDPTRTRACSPSVTPFILCRLRLCPGYSCFELCPSEYAFMLRTLFFYRLVFINKRIQTAGFPFYVLLISSISSPLYFTFARLPTFKTKRASLYIIPLSPHLFRFPPFSGEHPIIL